MLKITYTKAEEIPEGYADLYTAQQDGTFLLTGVDGMKTEGDVGRVQEALRKERSDHIETKSKLSEMVTKTSQAVDDYNRVSANLRKTKVDHEIERAARDAHVISDALPDVLAAASQFKLDEAGNVVGPSGETADQWIQDMKENRGHWWPVSLGASSEGNRGGGGASDGVNPWEAKHFSKTAQGAYVKLHGLDAAKKAARKAGSSLNATTPPGH